MTLAVILDQGDMEEDHQEGSSTNVEDDLYCGEGSYPMMCWECTIVYVTSLIIYKLQVSQYSCGWDARRS